MYSSFKILNPVTGFSVKRGWSHRILMGHPWDSHTARNWSQMQIIRSTDSIPRGCLGESCWSPFQQFQIYNDHIEILTMFSEHCSHTLQKNHLIALKGQDFRWSFEKLSWTSLLFLGLHFLPFLFSEETKVLAQKKSFRRKKPPRRVRKGGFGQSFGRVGWTAMVARGVTSHGRQGARHKSSSLGLADRNTRAAMQEHIRRHFR